MITVDVNQYRHFLLDYSVIYMQYNVYICLDLRNNEWLVHEKGHIFSE